MDNIQKGTKPIYVFATTNVPDSLDNAVTRRFAKKILVDQPSSKERASYIKSLLQPCVLSDKELESLSEKCKNSSFMEILLMVGDVVDELFTEDLKSKTFVKISDTHYIAKKVRDKSGLTSIDLVPTDCLRGSPIKYQDLKKKFDKPLSGAEQKHYDNIIQFQKRFPK